MRLTWKLALLLAIGVGMQLLVDRYASEIDEARFAIRVYFAHLCGGTAADVDVMDLAVELRDRQFERIEHRVVAGKPATQPSGKATDPALLEELESSLSSAYEPVAHRTGTAGVH